MASVNKVILIGNLGRDPEVHSFPSGDRVCNMTIATSDQWTDKATGERKEKTEWTRVVIYNDKIVEVAEKYLTKGSKVYIEGALQTRKWTDKDGNERYQTEVVVNRYAGQMVMLDKPPARTERAPMVPLVVVNYDLMADETSDNPWLAGKVGKSLQAPDRSGVEATVARTTASGRAAPVSRQSQIDEDSIPF